MFETDIARCEFIFWGGFVGVSIYYLFGSYGFSMFSIDLGSGSSCLGFGTLPQGHLHLDARRRFILIFNKAGSIIYLYIYLSTQLHSMYIIRMSII